MCCFRTLHGEKIRIKGVRSSARLVAARARLGCTTLSAIGLADMSQNIRLRTGDLSLVPDNSNERAYVFGGAASSNPAGGAVTFVDGRSSLIQALAEAGFGRAISSLGV